MDERFLSQGARSSHNTFMSLLVEQGILNEPLEIAGEDEIAQLAVSFNQMRAAVLAYQTDLDYVVAVKPLTAR